MLLAFIALPSTVTVMTALIYPWWRISTQIGEREMGSLSNESLEEFLDSLKQAAVEISNEAELRERLLEARHWRFAFTTLASYGRSIGIRFEDRNGGCNVEEIHRTFVDFQFPEKSEAAFLASLKASY
jgi:hypothetical protein